MTPEQIMVASALGILAALGLVTWLSKRLRPRPSAPAGDGAADDAKAVRDMADLLEQLDLLIKDVNRKLDSRLAELDKALRDADGRIAELRELADRTDAPTTAPPPGSVPPVDAENRDTETWDRASDTVAPPAPGQDEEVTLPGTWPLPAGPTGSPPAPGPAGYGHVKLQSPRHAEIVRLHSQGLDTVDIARRLQMDVGEVELVLNLSGCHPRPRT